MHIDPEILLEAEEDDITDLIEEIELEGHIKVDEGLLMTTGQSKIIGSLSAKIPRTVSPTVQGHVGRFNNVTLLNMIQRPESEEYSPCIYILSKPTSDEPMAGTFQGCWCPIALNIWRIFQMSQLYGISKECMR